MDLLSVLPGFATKPYAHILPPLERAHINVVDLITLDTLEIAKRAHVPPTDVRRLSTSIVDALHQDVGFERLQSEVESSEDAEPSSSVNLETPLVPAPATRLDLSQWSAISTLDPALDDLLDGGIPTGYVTEVTGESGSGKTQFLLSLLLAVQLPSPRGLGKSAIYISTEAALATPRLSHLLDFHPYLSTLPRDHAPSLENILSINAMDLESQEHILNYQLPVAISRYNVGLVVIDSITSNYRAEHSSSGIQALSMRSGELAKLGQLLRNLAVNENLAVVVANQVSDRFDQGEGHPISRIGGGNSGIITGSQSPMPKTRPEAAAGNAELLSQPSLMLPASSPAFPSSPYVEEEQQQQQQQFDGSYLVGNPVRNEILSLVHQQRFFTGWGDTPPQQSITPTPVYSWSFPRSTDKTPALGFVWATQIGCRIALKKELPPEDTADLTIPVPDQNTSTPTPTNPPRPPTRPTEDNTKPEPSTQQPPTNQTGESDKPESNPPTLQNTPPEPAVERTIRRKMKLVFAPWSAGSTFADGNGKQEVRGIRDEVDFKIWKGGLQSINYD